MSTAMAAGDARDDRSRAPERPPRGGMPPLRAGRAALAALAWLGALAAAALLLHDASLPGGGPLLGLLLVPAALGAAGLGLLVLLILAIAQRRMAWPLLAVPAVLALVVLVCATPLPQTARWPLIRADLEAAREAGTCPAWAGGARVERCGMLAGAPGYDFGGGFLNSEWIAYLGDDANSPPTLPAGADGCRLREDLGGGWWHVTAEW